MQIYEHNNGEIIQLFARNLKIGDKDLTFEIIQGLYTMIRLDTEIPLRGQEKVVYKFEVAGGLN